MNQRVPSEYELIGQEIGRLVDEKQRAYGNSVEVTEELFKVWLKPYRKNDNTYVIPEELLSHILLLVRITDKINRIISNPKGDLMGESPYSDINGYSTLGIVKSRKTK